MTDRTPRQIGSDDECAHGLAHDMHCCACGRSGFLFDVSACECGGDRYDICTCGDYRYQHIDGGRCSMCATHRYPPPCQAFELELEA